MIPAVKNGFQTEASFTEFFSSAQMGFYKEKSKNNYLFITYSESANTDLIQDSFLKSFLGSNYDKSKYKADSAINEY